MAVVVVSIAVAVVFVVLVILAVAASAAAVQHRYDIYGISAILSSRLQGIFFTCSHVWGMEELKHETGKIHNVSRDSTLIKM